MRIYRISLKNYRVFEDQVDVEMPSGLIGIFGPNGAGKSYFIESIPWTLFGRSRTSVGDIRTTGSDGECVTEIEFEHEDHLIRVNRLISTRGTVRARSWVDNKLISDGVKDTNRFVQSTLGMDIDSFRSSVFAEQKQVASFSDAAPADRQRLVLSLLGVTPLDKARDMARTDARSLLDQLKMARLAMPDLSQLEQERKSFATEADAAKTTFEDLDNRFRQLSATAKLDSEQFNMLQSLKARSDQIIAIGKEKRKLLDELVSQGELVKAAHLRLEVIAIRLDAMGDVLGAVSRIEDRITEINTKVASCRERIKYRDGLTSLLSRTGCQSISQLHEALEAVRVRSKILSEALADSRDELRVLEVESSVAQSELKAIEANLAALNSLGTESPCPTCGQILGEAFQSHLEEASAEFEKKNSVLSQTILELEKMRGVVSRAEEGFKKVSKELESRSSLSLEAEMLVGNLGNEEDQKVDLADLEVELSSAIARLRDARGIQMEFHQLCAEKAEIEKALRTSQRLSESVSKVESELLNLKNELRSLNFNGTEYEQKRYLVAQNEKIVDTARERKDQARLELARTLSAIDKTDALIDQAISSRQLVHSIEMKVEIIGRVADYLGEFRRSVIASLGPRLAASAASLFAELTESDYDRLEVDADSWQLRISDSGEAHDLDRFSGSERDLANLAFRIAISEQIGQSFGQQVGLLVLDEVFGPLDDQRRSLMLGALENLKGRFNQVIVVTHGIEIKEQLPGAIEIVKLGRRRATVRVG